MPEPDVTVRECVSVEDFQQCIALEREVWKDDDIGIMPIRLYMLSKACRAPTIGAFDDTGRLVGFVHTSLALKDKNVIYHSHLAAVVEGLRHKDIGRRMKLAQRDFAIEAGIPLIIWTIDPLQSRNAHLNINKLGAIIRRYEINYYGEGLSPVFGVGVPTDRVFAEWWLLSPRVKAALAGDASEISSTDESVVIPDDIDSIRVRSADDHLKWRLRIREEFTARLGRGLVARGFERDQQRSESRYLFGPDEEQFHFGAYTRIRTSG